jgi:predicted secreted Zn-dependent protease
MSLNGDDVAKATRQLTLAEKVDGLTNELLNERREHQRTRTALLQFLDFFLSDIRNHDVIHKVISKLNGEEQMDMPKLGRDIGSN